MRKLAAAAMAAAAAALCASAVTFHAAEPIRYRFTFPQPEHHWMQVEAAFSGLDAKPLELRMSRSSPGRYSIHDFAKNVYDVHATGADGHDLALTRPDPYGWTVPSHGPALTVRYKVFGDRVDGTYLAIDNGHAHINMPAAILFPQGPDIWSFALTFVPPQAADGAGWQAASQLHPAGTPFEFTAPNLQYLMDSPIELGPIAIRQFTVDGRTFRFALHHTGTSSELDSFIKDVEKVVRQEAAVFGEFPQYEPGSYTFLADYLPYASSDGMEHRNSTVMTSARTLRADRDELIDTVAHEFFHNWNVERIRPRSLEPFDFERANMSGELWLAEGFTQYYGPLALSRSGIADIRQTTQTLTELVAAVSLNPGRAERSPEEMSRMAPFVDRGQPGDRTNWRDTYISYYSYGGAIALALDLSLRERSDSRVTLDDFMRAMWRVHGRPGGSREGYVDRPYTIDDAQARLAEVSGDAAFARDFFARYVHGRELPDYARLLARAGMALRKINPGRAWWGDVRLEVRHGVASIAQAPLANTPAYKAGLDEDAQLHDIDGTRIASAEDVQTILRRRKPGDRMTVGYSDRAGTPRSTVITLEEDPHLEIVPREAAGGTLTDAERRFRAGWLGGHD